MQETRDIHMTYIGNPVLDVSVYENDRTILNQYGLEIGMATLATPEQMPIYDQLMAREDKVVGAGGSALNSARAQRYSNMNGPVAYLGCIGNDNSGRVLIDAVKSCGIIGRFEMTEEVPTSMCASVVVGKERTLCADIRAAKKFTLDYLNANMVREPLLFDENLICLLTLGNPEPLKMSLHNGIFH